MKEEKINKTRIGVYGLIQNKEQLLLCRISEQVPESAGMWTLPGGGLNFGEHPEQGMIREVLEETGLQVRPVRIAGVDSILVENPNHLFHSLRIVYYAEVMGGFLENEVNGTTDLCQWHNIKDLDDICIVDLVQTSKVWFSQS